MKIFSVFDSKVESYMTPFFMRHNGEAIRAFTQMVTDTSNPNNMAAKYPADFTLFELGSFDDSTGKISTLPTPKSLGVGSEFVSKSV